MKGQIDYVLPRSAWDEIEIHENNEPLVLVKERPGLILGSGFGMQKPNFFVRTTIAEKLYKVATYLFSIGYQLVLIEGYRTMEDQQREWNRAWRKVRRAYPDINEEEIEKMVRLIVAKPSPLANHHCGGAIDVTVADLSGKPIDMGSEYIKIAEESDRKKFKMFSTEITREQIENREILRNAMSREQFVWYPGEWWHYCWGDRMWAVYGKHKSCFYGPIELP